MITRDYIQHAKSKNFVKQKKLLYTVWAHESVNQLELTPLFRIF